MFRARLSLKFLLLLIGILAVLLGIFSAFIVRRESRILARKDAEQEQLLARMIVADLKESMLSGRPRSTLAMTDSLQGAYGLVRLAVLRKDGTPAFGRTGPAVALPRIEQAVRSGRAVVLDEAGDVPLHTSIVPLANASECRRCHGSGGGVLGVIVISRSLEDTTGEIRNSKRHLLELFGALVLAAGSVLYLIVRRMVLLPLQTLHQGAEALGRGDLSQRIVIGSGDEFEELAASFNGMADRMKEMRDGLENTVRVRTTELNESIRLMRGILSSMPSGVALLDRDGTVNLMNRQGARILGRGHEDLLEGKLSAVVPETAAFLEARTGSYEETTVHTPGGRSTPVGFITSRYAGSEGDREGLIVVFQDLTGQKALQAGLVDKERLTAAGRVAAGIAHQIRSPLSGIIATGRIFERDLRDPAHQELVRTLLAGAERLDRLAEELLICGMPRKPKLEEADLRVLWEEVLDLHRDELRSKGIKFSGDYAVRHPVALFDPRQIRQVFSNILRNAIEAMPGGGSLSIMMLLEDEFIVFRISDTGAGVPAGQLEHVFGLFFTTKPKGTGLGLAVCRKIVQDHGGDISLTSEEGRGTTVMVRLPYHGGESVAAAGAVIGPASLSA